MAVDPTADPELKALKAELVEATAPRLWPSGAARGIQRMHYSHDALVDLIIANPFWTQDQLAQHTGYSACWLSQIINSDAFQTKLWERRDALVDPALRATVTDQLQVIFARSLEVMRQKLNEPASAVPAVLALKALEVSSKALGYGAAPPAAPPESGEAVVERLGGNLTSLLRRKRVEVTEEIHVIERQPSQG